jgi:hemoglobin-like flavoprotein
MNTARSPGKEAAMTMVQPHSRTLPRHPGLPLHTIELLEASYARIEGRSRAMALAFYDELFLTAPTLRALFPRDDQEQRRLAVSFIGFVITNLRAVGRLVPLLERMGERGLLRDLTLEELDSIGKTLMLILRDWNVSKLLQEETSSHFCCPGAHTSRSYFFVCVKPISPVHINNTRYGKPRSRSNRSASPRNDSSSSYDVLGWTNFTNSTLSN